MMHRTRGILALPAVIAMLALSGCGKMDNPWKDKGGPPRVVASFPPLTSWVKKLSDDRAAVITLCTTIGPHDYTVDIRQAILLKEADLLLANGLGLDDSFTDRLETNSGNRRLRYRRLAASLTDSDRLKNKDYVPGKHEHDADGGCCGHGPHDPHAWLGLPQAILMVRQLRDDLKEVDPAHAAEYDARAGAYVKELQQLLEEGREKLKGLKKTPIISHHESMGYFAAAFRLNDNIVGSVRGLDGQAAGSRKLADLAEKCKGHSRVILTVEPQYPRSMTDQLQRALRQIDKKLEVVVVKLDPMETCDEDELTADWYVNRMRANINALAEAVP